MEPRLSLRCTRRCGRNPNQVQFIHVLFTTIHHAMLSRENLPLRVRPRVAFAPPYLPANQNSCRSKRHKTTKPNRGLKKETDDAAPLPGRMNQGIAAKTR